MKLSEIQELIKFVSKSGISEVEIEDKDFKINIKKTTIWCNDNWWEKKWISKE